MTFRKHSWQRINGLNFFFLLALFSRDISSIFKYYEGFMESWNCSEIDHTLEMNSPHCLGPVWARAYKYAIRRVGKWKMQLLDPWMFIFYIMTGITLDKQFICKVTQNPQLTPTMYIQNVQGWHTYLVSCITWIIVDLTWNDCYYTKQFKVVVLWSRLWIVPAIFNSLYSVYSRTFSSCKQNKTKIKSKTAIWGINLYL